MLKIYPMPVGSFQTNCYILSSGDGAIIVDPGDDASKIITYLATKELKPAAIFVTHGHFDHIGALKEVQAKYEIPVYTHKDEAEFFTDSKYNFSWKSGRTPIEFGDLSVFNLIEEDGIIEIIDQKIKVLHVPGHSPGSLAFYFEDSDIVITGDALFKGSIGRTDLGGNHEQLIKNIETKLFTLPDSTVAYPGHGQATTIGDEKRMNPFF